MNLAFKRPIITSITLVIVSIKTMLQEIFRISFRYETFTENSNVIKRKLRFD